MHEGGGIQRTGCQHYNEKADQNSVYFLWHGILRQNAPQRCCLSRQSKTIFCVKNQQSQAWNLRTDVTVARTSSTTGFLIASGLGFAFATQNVLNEGPNNEGSRAE
jgi:hypothetical protein